MGHFLIAGAILGCLRGDAEDNKGHFDLEVTEHLPQNPWRAVVRTKSIRTDAELREFFDAYQLDPDGNGTPYYFAVKDTETGDLYVVFNDEYVLYPLNSREERMRAYELGLKKGLVHEQIDFVHHEIQGDEFAF